MKRNVIRAVLLAVGAGMVAAGVLMEQYRAVWVKAARVCLECIGLG